MDFHVSLSGGSRNKIGELADLEMPIAVGFGYANILKNDEIIFREQDDKENIRYLKEFDERAENEPGVWQCVLEAPLWNATWKRIAKGQWECIESGIGFA